MFSTIIGSLSLLSVRQKFAVALLSLATLLINCLDLVAISLLGLVGSLALGESSVEIIPWFAGVERETLVISLLLFAAGVFATKTLCGVVLSRVRYNFLASLEVHFSKLIAANVFSGDLGTVKKYSRSYLEWTILRSTSTAFGTVVGGALILFAEASLTLLILALFFYTDWVSAVLVSIYFVAVLLGFQLVTRHTLGRAGSDFTEGSVSVGQAISDTLQAFQEISVLSRIPHFLDRISFARQRTARATAKHGYLVALPRLVVELALIVGAIGFAAYHFAASSGSPDLSVISVFIVGSLRIMSSLLPLYRSYMNLRFNQSQAIASQALVSEAQGAISARREALPNGEEASSNAIEVIAAPLEVFLNDVTFKYEDRGGTAVAIDQITLKIEPGSTVALVGPSGAGKSTIVDLILGLREPASGTVSCSRFEPKALRHFFPGLMSYVPQKPGLIYGTLRENIALGVPADDVDENRIWEVIREAQIENFIKGLPDGINTHLGEQNDGLSGGQIQRIGVARALYTRPRLLVLDEATSALDPETEASIAESLDNLRGETTTVIVAHRLSTVQNADVVFVIDEGKLVASGKLRDLERDVPLVKKYIALMSFGT